MKLHVLSDLHLEFGSFEPPETGADVIVIAGDIAEKDKGLKWIKQHLSNKPVVYVLGNHEYYRKAVPHLTDKLRKAAENTNIHVLENENVCIDGVQFVGCTLWTDFRLLGNSAAARIEAQQKMTDYRIIRLSTAQFRKLRPNDTIGFHLESRRAIERALNGRSPGKNAVVVTHHAPSILSLREEERSDELSPAYASNLDDFVTELGADLWIHGHIHCSSDYMLGHTRVLCNPRGYAEFPNPLFDPGLVVEI